MFNIIWFWLNIVFGTFNLYLSFYSTFSLINFLAMIANYGVAVWVYQYMKEIKNNA